MAKKKPTKKSPEHDASTTVYVDPAKLRSPTDQPLTAENLREGRIPLDIGPHQGSSPHAVDRALSDREVASNERRAQATGKSRLARDPKLPPRQGGRS
jgi:hypothetical protein